MKIVQYTMSFPKEKEIEFLRYAKDVLGPTWKRYGYQKHGICKIIDKVIVGRQIVEKEGFIERLYSDDDFDISRFYSEAKRKEPEKTKSYEDKFGAY